MRVTQLTLIITYMISTGQSQMDPFIVDGYHAAISDFSHSAYLYIKCAKSSGCMSAHMCGSSILNQYVTLTAAHCTSRCMDKLSFVIYVGHSTFRLGATSTADRYRKHPFFDGHLLINDLALVRVKTPFSFNQNVNRVALMEFPPYAEEGIVAGWGKTSQVDRNTSETLRYAIQTIKRDEDCPKRFDGDGYGTLCTESKMGHAAAGDSGSALIIHGYIQIGIVSFASKVVGHIDRIVRFTDTGFFFDWIKENTEQIMCSDGEPGDVDIE